MAEAGEAKGVCAVIYSEKKLEKMKQNFWRWNKHGGLAGKF